MVCPVALVDRCGTPGFVRNILLPWKMFRARKVELRLTADLDFCAVSALELKVHAPGLMAAVHALNCDSTGALLERRRCGRRRRGRRRRGRRRRADPVGTRGLPRRCRT